MNSIKPFSYDAMDSSWFGCWFKVPNHLAQAVNDWCELSMNPSGKEVWGAITEYGPPGAANQENLALAGSKPILTLILL